jgi:hypothetical protein
MDPVTALVTVFGPVAAKALTDIWGDFRSRSNAGQSLGIVASSQGYEKEIPLIGGSFAVPTVYRRMDQLSPLLLEGQFIGDESFIDFADIVLDEEEKSIIIIAIDQETGDSYFFEFGFDGYAISMWPGNYILYAFILAPIFDDVIGFGYPFFEDLEDPNPIEFGGGGKLEMDFIIFDVSELT